MSWLNAVLDHNFWGPLVIAVLVFIAAALGLWGLANA